jgi:dolichol-phosphate mannosyltransferase
MEPQDRPRRAVSVIFPTYNERDNIGPLVEDVLRYTPADTEVIVVDDDSPDGTWQVVEEMQKGRLNLHLLRRRDKRGLASALRDGIAFSRGDIIVWSDCDFSMPPAKVRDLLSALETGHDIAVGSRYVAGGGIRIVVGSNDSLRAYVMSVLLNRFIQRVLGRGFKDYTSGFIAFRRRVLDRITLRGDYGEYFIDFIHRARRLGYSVIEIPYMCVERRSGVGKTGAKFTDYLKKGWKYVWLTVKLRFTRVGRRDGSGGKKASSSPPAPGG